MAGALGQRTVLAPAGHAAINQPRVARQADLGAKPQTFHHAWAEALDQAVGLGHQGQHRVNRRRVFEIQRDRAAPPIEQGGAAGTAQRVTTRPVDSNDLGAHVRQHHAAMGGRADADHFDDP